MPQSPWDSINAQDEQDSLHKLKIMLTGTKALQDEPGLVYSLAQQQAHPADAQAIDQFMQSLNAEKKVALARAAGDQIVLSDQERYMLGHNGVPFRDVWYTQQDFAKSAVTRVMDATGGKYTPALNADGTLALDSHGNVQVQEVHHSDGGWFDSFGSFFDHLGGALLGAGKDVLHGINRAYHFVQTGLTGGYASQINPTIQGGSALDPNPTRAQDMAAEGYDPNSLWSTFAWGSSGKAHTNLGSLNDRYGSDKVDEALHFLNDPTGFRKSIETDPASYFVNSEGRDQLTPDAQAKLSYLASPEFEGLARQINAHQATMGNSIATAIGIDPVQHSTLYQNTAAGFDLAAAFFVDPTMVAFKVAQAAKLSAVGIDTLGDMNAASILTSKGIFARQVQRGWQRGIDLAGQYREAMAAGDVAKAATVTAQFRAQLPGLEPIWENFTGGKRVFQGFSSTETEIVNGKLIPARIFGPSEGFKKLDDAAEFISEKYGLLRLVSGRAGTQGNLMPGALSAFGYRKLKGITAGWMTARSANRAQGAISEVLTRAEADPALAAKLIDDKTLVRMTPQADDAVHFFDGTVLAQRDAEAGLASEARGQLAVTPEGLGTIKSNLRHTGDVLGESTLGRFTATAIRERFRQAGIRLSTLLPRNTMIDLKDARSGDLIYKTAMTYLNRGEANTLRAIWNGADFGQRKVIVHALIDQIGHAAGLGETETGRKILAETKTAQESYMAGGGEIVLDGAPVAPFEGQTRTQWMLPSFQEMQKAAARISLGEKTFGRAFNSNLSDTIMSQWKMQALFKPSTVTRNMLEGWLRTALEGRAGTAIKAKAFATARNKELWKRGFGADAKDLFIEQRGKVEGLQKLLAAKGLSTAQRADAFAQITEAKRLMATVESRPIVQHLLATESGKSELARQIANGSMLDGETLGRSTATNWLANTAPLATIGRAYRSLIGRHMDEETLRALLTYGPDELQQAMEGYGLQLIQAELGFRSAAKESTEIAEAGYGPARIRFAMHRARERGQAVREHLGSRSEVGVRWTHQAVDGTKGADRYANALGSRVNAMPETARAALANIADRDITPLSEVVKALEGESHNTAFGNVYFPDIVNRPLEARKAATVDESEVGKLDWANKVVEEYRYLLTGQNGEFAHELANYITERGVAPDSEWLSGHLTNDARPEAMLAPEVMAMSPGGVPKIFQVLQDNEGGAYQWLVERPLQRTTSSPVFLANYAIARKGLNPAVEKMVGQGISREASENLAKDLATRNAWVKTEQLIDDPGQKAQFDVIARNMIPFARATQAMIRRWATGLWQNPVAARKMMLAYEGAVHSGFIYKNAYGEATFTYPGSGVLNLALRGLAQVPGFESIAAFPVSASMSGQVLMSVPGADNPFRMSMGPMISIPFREVYTTILPYLHAHLGINTAGTQEALMKMDTLINGPIGTGETWVQLVPTAVRKFYVALNGDDRNSALASSMKGAIAYLGAAGLLPPPDASASQKQEFRAQLQTQVKSQLFLRAVFGLFSPASPSTPSEQVNASSVGDYAWNLGAMQLLEDEYKQILNEVGGDLGRATAIWTGLHPDRVVYDANGDLKKNFLANSAITTAQSGAISPGAYLPSTEATLKWMDRNTETIQKFGSIAAYFLPAQAANEPFSDAAYKAQLEFGLRLKKTPQEFMEDIYVKHAESVFYPADHALNAKIAAAQASGDTALYQQLTQLRHDWLQKFKAINPLFGDKIDNYGAARKTANQQLGDLRQMVAENAAPDGLGPKLGTLLRAYDNYTTFLNAHQGQNSFNVGARQNALGIFNRWAAQELTGTPLASLFNGVFRVLNTNFDTLTGVQG